MPGLLEAGVRVIDLAGDFRLPAADYPVGTGSTIRRRTGWTRPSTACRSCSASAVRGAQLVANPGCYPTPVILGLAPLLAAGSIEPSRDPRRRQDRAVGRRDERPTEASLFTATEE